MQRAAAKVVGDYSSQQSLTSSGPVKTELAGRSSGAPQPGRGLQIEWHAEQACARRMQAHAERGDSGRHDGNVLFHCCSPGFLQDEDSATEFPFWHAVGSNAAFAECYLLTIIKRSFRAARAHATNGLGPRLRRKSDIPPEIRNIGAGLKHVVPAAADIDPVWPVCR